MAALADMLIFLANLCGGVAGCLIGNWIVDRIRSGRRDKP